MDEIAWKKKCVRGPYNVADYMQEVAPGGPKGGAFSDYYNEKARPTTDTLERFCKAFEVTEEERWKLA